MNGRAKSLHRPCGDFLTVVVLGSLGGGLFFGTPFESSRPKEPIVASLTDNAEVVPARLRQDPFTAKALTIAPVMVDGDAYSEPASFSTARAAPP